MNVLINSDVLDMDIIVYMKYFIYIYIYKVHTREGTKSIELSILNAQNNNHISHNFLSGK